MAEYADYTLARYEDGVLAVEMTPPTNISGWAIEAILTRRFGEETPIARKSCASGFNNVSGINITNGGQGHFQVSFFASEVSGVDPGNLACVIRRTQSGVQTEISKGFRLMDY